MGPSHRWLAAFAVLTVVGCASGASQLGYPGAPVAGWLAWRGPTGQGVSDERSVPEDLSLDGPDHLWSYGLGGGGTPILAGSRVYVFGTRGQGAETVEVLACLDGDTGKLLWEQTFPDFLSDIIYERYAIGSPAVDPATGHVYVMTSSGLATAHTSTGEPMWQRSLMESIGRLTFPNGRTGAPVVMGDVVVVRGITTSWGALGPGRDRFVALDVSTGEVAWISTPGTRPVDSSFSTPVLATHAGRPVLVAGTGCGNVVAMDARDGKPVWRMPLSRGGVNATVLIDGPRIFAIHGKESLDSSRIGAMVAFHPGDAAGDPAVLGADHVVWQTDVASFTSSPVLLDGIIYQVTASGTLVAIDAETGDVLWSEKLAHEQLHASPLVVGDRLIVPMQDGSVHQLRPDRDGPGPVTVSRFEGSFLGAPSVWAGRLYLQTTEALHVFGSPSAAAQRAPEPQGTRLGDGGAARLAARPAEIHAVPGDRVSLSARAWDASGAPVAAPEQPLRLVDAGRLAVGLRGGALHVASDATPGTAVVTLGKGRLETKVRVRLSPAAPWSEDFERTDLVDHPKARGVRYAHPPGWWLSARLKWEVRVLDGDQVLAKTLDRLLFQRATTFIGHPAQRGYTLTADVRSDGNRRNMGSVGVVNQRYVIALDGNRRELEVHSNFDRFHHAVPFRWEPDRWYRLKTRVDVVTDGSGRVRAKAWPRDEPEPEGWMLSVRHARAHTHGAAGLYGFSPQGQHRVYVDNITMTSSAAAGEESSP